MSLKLCCALPVTLNCLKSTRLLFLAPEYAKLSSCSIKKSNLCASISTQQARWYSPQDSNKNTIEEKPKNTLKRVYHGLLAPHVRAVKLFSISSSIVGLTVQPILYKELVATANIPVILAAYSFIGFFTVVTPLLLHTITKKYVMDLYYNSEKDTFVAKTLNLFCAEKQVEFKVEDVHVPDVPGMFVTFKVKGKPLFVDPRTFDNPEYYAKLMGYDKPIDFKLYDTGDKLENTPTGSSSK